MCHVFHIIRDSHQGTKRPSIALSNRALGTKAPAELPPVEPLTCEQWAPCSCGQFEPLDDSGCGMCSSCGAAIESQLPAAVQAWVQASRMLVQQFGPECCRSQLRTCAAARAADACCARHVQCDLCGKWRAASHGMAR